MRVITRSAVTISLAALWAVLAAAQSAALRTTPTEKFTVNPGFRDWARATISGSTIVAGNSSNRGGLFAVDIASGKLKWSARPTGLPSGNFVATAPAVVGNIVLAPMGNMLVAFSLDGGKEMWRGPATAQGESVAVDDETAFVMGEDNSFHALDARSGREKWKVAFARVAPCHSAPVVRDGVVYLNGNVMVKAADANQPASYQRYLIALEASSGKERWRYSSATPVSGGCFEQPVVTADTYFAIASQSLYAINLATGRERWKPIEVRREVEGRSRYMAIGGLVDAGTVLVGVTRVALIAFDKRTGQIAWDVPGQYRETAPATAVAGDVLYFQGHPGASPASEVQDRIVYVGGKPVAPTPALPGGRLNALDLNTRKVLWSFSRPTAEPNWSFGFVTPVDGGLWVDSYQALIKLQ